MDFWLFSEISLYILDTSPLSATVCQSVQSMAYLFILLIQAFIEQAFFIFYFDKVHLLILLNFMNCAFGI